MRLDNHPVSHDTQFFTGVPPQSNQRYWLGAALHAPQPPRCAGRCIASTILQSKPGAFQELHIAMGCGSAPHEGAPPLHGGVHVQAMQQGVVVQELGSHEIVHQPPIAAQQFMSPGMPCSGCANRPPRAGESINNPKAVQGCLSCQAQTFAGAGNMTTRRQVRHAAIERGGTCGRRQSQVWTA